MNARGGREASVRVAVLLALVTLIAAGVISLASDRGSGDSATAPSASTLPTTTTAVVPAVDAGTSTPTTTTTSSTTTSTSTTTTTTVAEPRLLEVSAVPGNALISVNTGVGSGVTAEGVLSETVAGPIELTVEADGYQTHTETLELEADTQLQVWLDKPGQLLHKIAQWSTAGAPKQVAFTPDNREVWVTLLSGTGFQVFDPSGELLAAIDLPEAGSVEVIFNRDGSRGYVSQMPRVSSVRNTSLVATSISYTDAVSIWLT